MFASLLLLNPLCGWGQNAQNETRKESPWHFEMGLSAGSPQKKIMPFGAVADVNYSLSSRFLLHAVAQGDYFHPKNGLTVDYNKTLNLGGGVGYVLNLSEDGSNSTLEARAFVTSSVSGKDAVRNTAYNAGIYWYGKHSQRGIGTVLGLGLSVRDFHKDGVPTYVGGYLSFGINF